MAQQSILSNKEIGNRIKSRRNELGLTIEEAASRAKVGTKTWCRYESGGAIRKDKCKGICKALHWNNLPTDTDSADTTKAKINNLMDEYKNHTAFSKFLADNYGIWAAISFAVGSDMLLEYIEQDLSDIAAMPVGSHIGQLSTSYIKEELPSQFLMMYTYDFLYQMKCTLIQLRIKANAGASLTAHSVLEELIIYLCSQEALAFIEITEGASETNDNEDIGSSSDWVFDLFDDADIISFLYSDINLSEEHPFFFTYWNDRQFYITSGQ